MPQIFPSLNVFYSLCCAALLGGAPISSAAEDWVVVSNQHAQVLLNTFAQFGPEGAAALGVDGLDEEIFDIRANVYERFMAATENVIAELSSRQEKASDPRVKKDLDILIRAAVDNMHSNQLQHENMLPYSNVSRTIFQGTRALIDPQVSKDRYSAVITRLRKYTGLEPGFTPITELARRKSEERFTVADLVGPFRGEVEQDLQRADKFIDGIRELLSQSGLENWQRPYQLLKTQLQEYNEWVQAEILPRAREDFRLPAVMYADALHGWGVDASPEELIAAATQGYMDIRNEMEALAPIVAAKKKYSTTDYREVIQLLKRERVDGDKLVAYYRDILSKLETIIVEQNLLSLPEREAGIRIASEAETAAQPAAHLDIPRLIGNTGEFPTFVIPKIGRDAQGGWIHTDDTFKAGAWTLTAHEARPGHELQFSSMLDGGVSIARGLFAFNSANVEGWALYAEAIAKPYMPIEAQLISLQYRLARAARMFLDPMLNLGRITPEDAKQLLLNDVVLGESWAQNEIERYTFRTPGQATAYYYGYRLLQSLRTQTELRLKNRFDAAAFHDFILAQGLSPPEVLKKAVMEEFVPAQLKARKS